MIRSPSVVEVRIGGFSRLLFFLVEQLVHSLTHTSLPLQSYHHLFISKTVFKVETIGDCYVAVTGLPEPRKDHAVVMARFARDCMKRMNELSHQLEVILGPDTGDLTMRFGLHSGPVTAGVLRGDKSRFQLFGDTVNTAARVESTGQKDKIHMSQETATLLIEGGKGHWVVPRHDVVIAKGKGEMTTFWLSVKGGSGSDNLEKNDTTSIPSQMEVNPKTVRLVLWNVDVLQRLLKLIIAKRNAETNLKQPVDTISNFESSIGKSGMVLDEMVEVVTLPKFNAKAAKTQVDPNAIQIHPLVMNQLTEYIKTIASMYRDNPFHNFEHASHVTMSVSKLLSRIVAPDIDEKSKDLGQSLHDHTYGITSDPLTQFAVVLSGLIHDVDHVGLPNFLLAGENTKLAETYKNKSVAEQVSRHIAKMRGS
jgi:class 3 adenylate cyclase